MPAEIEQHRPSGDAGLSLVEVLMAMLLLGVGLSALAAGIIGSLTSLTTSEARQEGYLLATRSLEIVRSYSWEELANAPDDPLLTGIDTFDHMAGEIDDPGGADPLVVLPDGQVTGADHQRDAPEDGFRLRTYVTETDDENLRRVTVLAEMARSGRTETVRHTTTISRARWGVEQPAFSVSPVNVTRSLERGTRVCSTHQITNRGLPDQYLIAVPSTSELSSEVQLALTQYQPVTLLQGATGEIPIAPNSPTPELAFEETYDFRVCLEPRSDADPATAGFNDLSIFVRSMTDPDTAQALLLNAEVEADRSVSLMSRGPEAPRIAGVPFALADNEGLEAEELTILDATFSGAGPGLFLPSFDPSLSLAQWNMHFNEVRTVASARLTLLTAADNSILEPPDAQNTYEVVLWRADEDGLALGTPLATVTFTGIDGRHAWTERVLDLPVAPQTFQPRDQLALSVRCVSGSEGCRLGFGTQAVDANLQLGFQGSAS